MMSPGDFVKNPPSTAFFHDDTTLTQLTNTSYEVGSPEVGVYFVAPPSGTVRITVGGGVRDNGTSTRDRVFLSPAVYLVTPTGLSEILAPSVTFRGYGGSDDVTEFQYGCRVSLLSGLAPGALYYARVMHTTAEVSSPDTNDTADIAARDLIVIPMP